MKENILIFIVFSLLYFVFEAVFNRITMGGIVEDVQKRPKKSFFCFTSIWMLPFGGICCMLINLIYSIPFMHRIPIFPFIMLIGGLIITGVELGGGMLLNVKLGLKIWDYSNSKIVIAGKTIPLNFKGQIDVWHTLGWCGITYLVCVIIDFVKWLI